MTRERGELSFQIVELGTEDSQAYISPHIGGKEGSVLSVSSAQCNAFVGQFLRQLIMFRKFLLFFFIVFQVEEGLHRQG